MDLDNHPLVLTVRKHFVDHLGPPAEVYQLPGSSQPNSPITAVQLAVFAPGGPEAPYIYVTCGASLFCMKDGRRVEAMFVLPRQPPPHISEHVRRLLGAFALFPEANDQVVKLGDVIRAADELAPISSMQALLFLPPFTFLPSFHRVNIENNETIDIVWLIPLHAIEANYTFKFGPQALLSLITQQKVDLTNPQREPADCSAPVETAPPPGPPSEPPPEPPSAAPSAASAPKPQTASDDPSAIQVKRRTAPTGGPPKSGQRRPPPRRPVIRPKARTPETIRFDLDKDGIVSKHRLVRAKKPAAPQSKPKPEKKQTKAERIAALKKAAKDARARAKAREEGREEPTPEAEAPTAAPRKKARPKIPFRRGGQSDDGPLVRPRARPRGGGTPSRGGSN
ncbi:MAG: suppressor of fused domain protein [Myxococcota bacterium]